MNNDSISRKMAIKAIDDLPNCYNGYSDTYDKAYIIGVLEELPTIDVPERKVGKWVVHHEVKNIYGGTCIECSECGEKYVVQHIDDEKFCRNCGARMEGEEDETN